MNFLHSLSDVNLIYISITIFCLGTGLYAIFKKPVILLVTSLLMVFINPSLDLKMKTDPVAFAVVFVTVVFFVASLILIYKDRKKKPAPQQPPQRPPYPAGQKIGQYSQTYPTTISEPKPEQVSTFTPEESINYSKIYTPKWMFTMNEKPAYFKLKQIAEPLGYTVFAKVRLFDLVEPRYKGEKNNKWLWKIQAKHCDFVLVDRKLVARVVVELDDSSHDRDNRKARDEFVDAVLKSCGYKVIHTREVTDEIRELL